MQTALSALVCRVCDVCRPSTGRTPGAGCGENRTEPAYHPYLTDYVDVHSVFVRSNTPDGDHGDYGTGCTPEESGFCSWQHRKHFSVLHNVRPALEPISLLLTAYGD